MVTSRIHRPRARISQGIAAAVTTVALVAGCGGADSEPTNATEEERVEGLVAVLAEGEADYEPAKNPADLAGRADLVVEGRISQFAPGPIYGSSMEDPEAIGSVVMQVEIASVLADNRLGSGTAETPEVAYVQIYSGDPDAYARLAPPKSPALLYLTVLPEPEKITPGEPVTNANAGRPASEPLVAPTTPQGFVLETTDGVVQPQEAREAPGATLDDYAPSAVTFPEERAFMEAG